MCLLNQQGSQGQDKNQQSGQEENKEEESNQVCPNVMIKQSEKIYEIEFWQKIRKREQAHFKSTGPSLSASV